METTVGNLALRGLEEFKRGARAVKEFGTAEGDVPPAGGTELPEFGEHALPRHREEAAAVHRRDRAV